MNDIPKKITPFAREPNIRNFFGLSFTEMIFLVNMVLLIIHFFSRPIIGVGMDLGRGLLLAATPLYFFYIVNFKREALIHYNVILCGFLIFSILASLAFGENVVFAYARQQIVIYLFGVVLCSFVYVMMVNNPSLLRGMGFIAGGWLALCLIFALISGFYYYILDAVPFVDSISVDQFKSARSKRMMLPAVKPPHLSVEAGLLASWLFFAYLGKRRFRSLVFCII